jgi:hypothetical protein
MGSTPGTSDLHPHGDLENPEVAHEESDVNIRAILGFVAILVITAVVIHVAMWGLFKFFANMEAQNDPQLSPLMVPAGQRPPDPQLQTTPWTDLRQFREKEDQRLHSYGWVDEKSGIAHLPIDKAKALLLQKGLPVRPVAADPAEGTHAFADGEASSGRNIPAPAQPAAPAQQPAANTTAAPAPAQPPAPKKPGGGA